MVTAADFVRPGRRCRHTGRPKGFFRAYELRMDSLVTTDFSVRVVTRLLEFQAALLARLLDARYRNPGIVTDEWRARM